MSESLSNWTGQPVQTQWTMVFSASKKDHNIYVYVSLHSMITGYAYTSITYTKPTKRYISLGVFRL